MSGKRTEDWHSFKEIVVNMTVKEKIAYIGTYYRWQIIGTIVVISLIFSVVWVTLTNKDAYLELVFVSGFEQHLAATDDSDLMTNDSPNIFVDFALGDTLEAVFLPINYRRHYEITLRNFRVNFENFAVLPILISGNSLDVIITYPSDLAVMIERGYFAQLASFGFNIPATAAHNEYAVYLRYFPIFSDYVINSDELVLAVVVNTERQQRLARFFEIFLE